MAQKPFASFFTRPTLYDPQSAMTARFMTILADILENETSECLKEPTTLPAYAKESVVRRTEENQQQLDAIYLETLEALRNGFNVQTSFPDDGRAKSFSLPSKSEDSLVQATFLSRGLSFHPTVPTPAGTLLSNKAIASKSSLRYNTAHSSSLEPLVFDQKQKTPLSTAERFISATSFSTAGSLSDSFERYGATDYGCEKKTAVWQGTYGEPKDTVVDESFAAEYYQGCCTATKHNSVCQNSSVNARPMKSSSSLITEMLNDIPQPTMSRCFSADYLSLLLACEAQRVRDPIKNGDSPGPLSLQQCSWLQKQKSLGANAACEEKRSPLCSRQDAPIIPVPLLERLPTKKVCCSSLQEGIIKTKLCIHHLSGRCSRAERCSFAHSVAELRQPPNLLKTRLCINFMANGYCLKGNNCR